MSKEQLFKELDINKIGNTVIIRNKFFLFSYTEKELSQITNSNEKEYHGGLKCNYKNDSEEYKKLEKKLCSICQSIIGNTTN